MSAIEIKEIQKKRTITNYKFARALAPAGFFDKSFKMIFNVATKIAKIGMQKRSFFYRNEREAYTIDNPTCHFGTVSIW